MRIKKGGVIKRLIELFLFLSLLFLIPFSCWAAGAWLELNHLNIDSLCGEDSPFTLVQAMSGGGYYWRHSTTEVHWFILDLGQTYTITKVKGRSSTSDDPTDVDIYVSDDKEDWGDPVITGISDWFNNIEFVEHEVTEKAGRYIKVVINDTEDPNDEIGFGKFAALYNIFDAYGEAAMVSEYSGKGIGRGLMRGVYR